MLLRDHALIGDPKAAALVGRKRSGALILAARAITKAQASTEPAAG
jgi:hypothetical protein